jgi:lipopolysaccharide transport system ATP-binding protein
MSKTAISVENVSKIYRLGEIGTGSLAHDVNRWWHRILGREDPYLKVGQINDRTKPLSKKSTSPSESDQWVYALKDINFEVNQGEVLGVIGRNGAGKSTLLKLLSRVTTQTSGQIKIKGRIASLLEVGTGFHPELTGRENIFLNGAILGMRKAEISAKLDEIVEFSGCARYLDTPVKRYSSGMYVRLAFAVAAHLDPEILVVDEVLAVGDADFQKKCLGKMKEVSKSGRTVLFVSHNMQAIATLCTRAIVLKNGSIPHCHDNVTDAIANYFANENARNEEGFTWNGNAGDGSIVLKRLSLEQHQSPNVFQTHYPIKIIFEIEVLAEVENVVTGVFVKNAHGNLIAYSAEYDRRDVGAHSQMKPGRYTLTCTIPSNTLAAGYYSLSPDIGIHNVKRIVGEDVQINFELNNLNGLGRKFITGKAFESVFRPDWDWQLQSSI